MAPPALTGWTGKQQGVTPVASIVIDTQCTSNGGPWGRAQGWAPALGDSGGQLTRASPEHSFRRCDGKAVSPQVEGGPSVRAQLFQKGEPLAVPRLVGSGSKSWPRASAQQRGLGTDPFGPVGAAPGVAWVPAALAPPPPPPPSSLRAGRHSSHSRLARGRGRSRSRSRSRSLSRSRAARSGHSGAGPGGPGQAGRASMGARPRGRDAPVPLAPPCGLWAQARGRRGRGAAGRRGGAACRPWPSRALPCPSGRATAWPCTSGSHLGVSPAASSSPRQTAKRSLRW